MCSSEHGSVSKKMRTDIQGPPVLWIEDVLLNIFQFLQHEDLVNCEAVCYTWMSFIRSGTLWKKVFQQKLITSRPWRRAWQRMELNKGNVLVRQYKHIYKAMFQYFQELDQNWCTGNYREKYSDPLSERVLGSSLTLWDKHITYKSSSCEKVMVVDRKSLKEIYSFNVQPDSTVMEYRGDCVICTDPLHRNIKIFKTNTNELVNELEGEDEWKVVKCSFNADLLVASSYNWQNFCRLTVWRMKRPEDITFLKEWTFKQITSETTLFVGSRYIAVCYRRPLFHRPYSLYNFCSISTKTLEIERSFSIKLTFFSLRDSIFLFGDTYGNVRLMNYSSGTYLQNIRVNSSERNLVTVDSFQCIVLSSQEHGATSTVNVYNCRANYYENELRGTQLSTFEVPFKAKELMKDESQMVCLVDGLNSNESRILVLDFGFHFSEYLSSEALQLHIHT